MRIFAIVTVLAGTAVLAATVAGCGSGSTSPYAAGKAFAINELAHDVGVVRTTPEFVCDNWAAMQPSRTAAWAKGCTAGIYQARPAQAKAAWAQANQAAAAQTTPAPAEAAPAPVRTSPVSSLSWTCTMNADGTWNVTATNDTSYPVTIQSITLNWKGDGVGPETMNTGSTGSPVVWTVPASGSIVRTGEMPPDDYVIMSGCKVLRASSKFNQWLN